MSQYVFFDELKTFDSSWMCDFTRARLHDILRNVVRFKDLMCDYTSAGADVMEMPTEARWKRLDYAQSEVERCYDEIVRRICMLESMFGGDKDPLCWFDMDSEKLAKESHVLISEK